MALRRYMTKVENCIQHCDKYFRNVVNNRIYFEDSTILYEKAIESLPLKFEHLFIDVDQAIEYIEEVTCGSFGQVDKQHMDQMLSKFNLMILLYNVAECKNLEMCCNNLFKEIFRHGGEYSDQEIDFSIQLRLYSLRHALTNNQDSNVHEEIEIYFPETFFFSNDELEFSEKVKALTLQKRDEVLLQDRDSITDSFCEEEINDDIVKYIKYHLDLSLKRSGGDEEVSPNKRYKSLTEEQLEAYALTKDDIFPEEANQLDDDSEEEQFGDSSLDRNDNPVEDRLEEVEEEGRVEDRVVEEAVEEAVTPRRYIPFRKVSEPWTEAEVRALKRGLRELKGPHWAKIIEGSNGALSNRSNVQCKDKAKTELNKLARMGLTEVEDLGDWKYVKKFSEN